MRYGLVAWGHNFPLRAVDRREVKASRASDRGFEIMGTVHLGLRDWGLDWEIALKIDHKAVFENSG